MSISLAGKSAIVTGAANGVGLAIARRFLDAGANVIFADKDEKRLKEEIRMVEAAPGQVRAFAGDLRERLAQANLLSAAIDAFDRVDILVNASRQVAFSDPLDREDDTFDRLLRVNVMATFRLSQLVAARMVQQAEADRREEGDAGAIVNLSSIAGQRTRPELLAYSVSCAALDQVTRSLAVALAPKRIRVNALAVGSVMSASLRDALRDDRSLRDAIIGATPLGRIAPPGEVAEVALFLASEGAAFITGEVVRVDGGRSILDAVATAAH